MNLSPKLLKIYQSHIETKPQLVYIDTFEVCPDSEVKLDQWYESTMTQLDELHLEGKITPQEFGILERSLFE